MSVGHKLGVMLVLATAGCQAPEPLDDVIATAVARAASRSSVRLIVGSNEDERWLPEAALPRFHLFPRDELAALDRYARRCGEAPTLRHGELRKALTWARSRCGHAPLPEGFFAAPPFLHPDGRSFAWHAHVCPEPDCQEAARSPELHHVLERSAVDSAHWPSLDRPALASLRAAEPFASVGSTLLVRQGGAYVSVALASVVGPRIGLGSGPACDSRALGRCWVDLDRRRPGALARAVVWSAALAFAVGLVAVLVWRVRAGRRLASERVFVLRWLAHELRTPVTALKLEVEGLRDDFDALPVATQDRFLTIARDVTRLQRVVEASTIYLRSHAARGEPPCRLDSLRSFVEALVDEAAEVHVGMEDPDDESRRSSGVELMAPDEPVELPVSTVALALRNLIRNALRHGRPPYRVRATIEPDAVCFTVSDDGQLGDATLRSLGSAFVGVGGEGLGIGLYLAHHAAASVGGSLCVSRDPTCFTLRIPCS